MAKYEVLVLGLGAMGSAAAFQLARRGRKVLGIDRFAPPHAYGSSTGEARMTRPAIGEGDHYTPLVLRSHELWREIEKESGADLLTVTGGLIISSIARTAMLHVDRFFSNTVAAAEKYRIPHQILSAQDMRKRFSPFRVRDDELGYYEPGAGFLRPESCIAAQLQLARKYGADIHVNEKVLAFEPSGDDVAITTDRDNYTAAKLIISAGAWLPALMGATYAAPFKVLRQLLFWFDVKGPITPFLPANCPIFIWELQGPEQALYGFPAIHPAQAGVQFPPHPSKRTPPP